MSNPIDVCPSQPTGALVLAGPSRNPENSENNLPAWSCSLSAIALISKTLREGTYTETFQDGRKEGALSLA